MTTSTTPFHPRKQVTDFATRQALIVLLTLVAGPAAAQHLTIAGATLTVETGASLSVPGGVTTTTGATLRNDGTIRVGGAVQNTGTLHLGSGTLMLQGDLTNAGTLVPGTGTVLVNGPTDQTLDANGATIHQLTVDKSAAGANRLLLPTDLTVAGPLTLTAGLVRTTPTAGLTLPEGATLTGEAPGRYVQGNLRVVRTAVGGGAPLDFGHGAVINPQGNTLGTLTLTRTAGLQTADVSYATDPARPGQTSIDRIWTVAPTQQPVSPVELTFSWLPDDDYGLTDLQQAQVWQQSAGNPAWATVGASTDASQRTISTTTGTLALARWTVGANSAVLPVELLTFVAERRGTAAQLQWATATESNCERFEVESSPDGRTFGYLGTVAGHGTTTVRHDYAFADPHLARYGVEQIYYRLRQVDTDGTSTYSDIRTVRIGDEPTAFFGADAFPSPFTDQLSVRVRTSQAGPATLSLTDATGRLVFQQAAELAAGTTTIRLPAVAPLPVGVYLIRVQQGARQTALRVVRE